MKKYFVIIACSSAILFSCNEEKKQGTTSTNSVTDTQTVITSGSDTIKTCYAKISGKDTVDLSFVIINNIVMGDLMYNFFEKDKNSGTITGKFAGDTLIADYTFKSEGMISVREVVFLKKGNTLIEGNGESEDQHGKWVFKNRSMLQFNNAVVLDKKDCK